MKNQISEHVFQSYNKPENYDFLLSLTKLLGEIRYQELNVNVERDRMSLVFGGYYMDDETSRLTHFDNPLPVFGFEEWHYTNLSGILLYPDYFNADMQFNGKAKTRNIGGIVGNGRFEKQMILSKTAGYIQVTLEKLQKREILRLLIERKKL